MQPALAADEPAPETMVVTANRSPQPELDTVGNIARLSDADIEVMAAINPHELGVRVPGVWIGRGSGQEHLTANGFSYNQISEKILTRVSSRAAAITEMAKKEGFDTIVVGRRGVSRPRSFFIGRVSNKAIHMARQFSVWVIN